jgi:hypothetical protein
MSPWTIIGWLLVAAACVPLLAVAVKLVAIPWRYAVTIARYLRTRNDAPAEGQRWQQGDRTLTVKRITDEGRIVLSTGGCASWSDSPEEWRSRVRERKMWRVR